MNLNIDAVIKAIEEAKLYTAKFFERAVTDKEVAEVLTKILQDKRESELRKRFSQFGPEYIVACLQYLREKK